MQPTHEPDEWESRVLKTFKHEDDYVFETIKDGDSIIYRYMAPLFVEQNCLACHSSHGFNIGEMQGGISINASYHGDYISQSRPSTETLFVIYVFIFLVGFFLLLYIWLL
jgi:hypothetical protein